jgi:hypothetical protein
MKTTMKGYRVKQVEKPGKIMTTGYFLFNWWSSILSATKADQRKVTFINLMKDYHIGTSASEIVPETKFRFNMYLKHLVIQKFLFPSE